jgi:hypothetical protein
VSQGTSGTPPPPFPRAGASPPWTPAGAPPWPCLLWPSRPGLPVSGPRAPTASDLGSL